MDAVELQRPLFVYFIWVPSSSSWVCLSAQYESYCDQVMCTPFKL